MIGQKKAPKKKIEQALMKAEKEKSAIKGKTFGYLINEGKPPATKPKNK